MTKIDGVIFDMDGLLFDTELIYYRSTQKIADAMGFPYSKATYLQFLGVSDAEVFENYQQMFQSFGETAVAEFLRQISADTHREFASGNVPLKEGVLDVLEELDQAGVPRVVASSNLRPTIELLLDSAGIKGRFSGIISAEDVQRAKPDPEIFNKARHFLGTAAERTLIFEDSFHGVTAAYKAGIPVIMVPDLIEPTPEIQQKTVTILNSLKEAPAYLKQ